MYYVGALYKMGHHIISTDILSVNFSDSIRNAKLKSRCCEDNQRKIKMTKSTKIQAAATGCLVVAYEVLADRIEGFSNLNLGYRVLIDVIVIFGILGLVRYTVKLVESHCKK